MIYCNLKGGLANMMFQIAAAKAFAMDANVECSFPNLLQQLRVLDDDMTHNPELKHSSEYLKVFANLRTDPIEDPNTPYQGFPFEYQEKVIGPNAIIDGFFQCEKYFRRHREAVLDMFDFSFISDEFVSGNYPFLTDETATTSIHVRRGDYLRNPFCHPPQTLEYYLAGMEYLKDKTDLFVVFSDDMAWCKASFTADNVVFVENEKDYIEIYLMSLCDNHVTCNSSFSWWGAWMNRSEDKVVVGPTRWFGPGIAHRTHDILPETWIKI